jgi:hypothetical protein
LQKEIAKKAKTFVPGAGLPDTSKPSGEFCVTFYDSFCAVYIMGVWHNTFVHIGYT